MADLEVRYEAVRPPIESVVLTMTAYEAGVLTDILARVTGNDGLDVAYRLYDMLDDAKLGATHNDVPYTVAGYTDVRRTSAKEA